MVILIDTLIRQQRDYANNLCYQCKISVELHNQPPQRIVHIGRSHSVQMGYL